MSNKKKKHRNRQNFLTPQDPRPATPGRGSVFGQFVHQQTSLTVTSGPIPSAKQLREYEDLLPGAAGRLFDEFQAQGKHRRRIEFWVVIGNVTSQWGGLAIAAFIAYFGLKWGVELLQAGKSLAGLGAVIVALGTLAGAFVLGKRHNTKRLTEKIAGELWESFLRQQNESARRQPEQSSTEPSVTEEVGEEIHPENSLLPPGDRNV